jgi:hypothetical protein
MADDAASPPPDYDGPTRMAGPVQIGPYVVEQKLGQGGMGTVYLGKHVETGDLAAVKVLPAALAREEGFVERFNREIDAMRRLDNANTVKLYESGTDGETYYYAMEYVPGETIMALLRRERKLPWQTAVGYAIQICHALKAAHDCGIIHRDLKPSNLLLTEDGRIKLTDFGVAQVFAAGRLTVTGGIIGTAEFMSPEQAQGKRATRQSDLYSLGAVLYCMVTGRPPFSGTTAVDIIQKHKFGVFDKARTYVPDLPLWLDEVISQLLDKDPAKRFPDAYVLARTLDANSRRILHSSGHTAVDGDAPTFLTEGDGAETRLDSGSAGGQRMGPATMAREIVRDTLNERSDHWLHVALDHPGILAGLLAVAVGLIVWLSWPKQISPDELWDRAERLLSQPPGPEWVEARDECLKPLRDAADSQWSDRGEPLWQRVALYEASKRKGLRRLLAGDDVRSGEAMRQVQRGFQLQAEGRFAEAEQTFTAVAELLASRDETADLAAQVRSLADRVREERASLSEPRDAWITAVMDRAEKLATEGKPDEARKVWEAVVSLYDGDPDAASHVNDAKKRLAK